MRVNGLIIKFALKVFEATPDQTFSNFWDRSRFLDYPGKNTESQSEDKFWKISYRNFETSIGNSLPDDRVPR